MNLSRFKEVWRASTEIYIGEIVEILDKDNIKLNTLIKAMFDSKNLTWDFLTKDRQISKTCARSFNSLVKRLDTDMDDIKFIKPNMYNRTFILFPEDHVYTKISEFYNAPFDLHYTEISMEEFIKEITVDKLRIGNENLLLEKD